jgi:fructan beta-fructosidase
MRRRILMFAMSCGPDGVRRWALAALATLCGGIQVHAQVLDEAPTAGDLYREAHRPQFHFTSVKDWINDPNGLVVFDGEYHLFFQRDPTNLNGSDYKSWGHAVASDLVHWRQLDDALTPDELGSMWSGSAVVDWKNTSGLGSNDAPPIVLIYTAAGGKLPESQGRRFTQAIAYSNDRGRTWTKYAGNPVMPTVADGNRDPKVVWHEPSKQWVMALYLDGDRFGLYGSPDLKSWRPLSELRVPGSSECPDFFEIPVEGEPNAMRWVFWTANNVYLVGTFDGTEFVAEGGPQRGEYSPDCYAAQTFSDVPAKDGRRILIAWMRNGEYPGMPFNQQLSLPTALTLRRFPEGLRLCKTRERELQTLRGEGGTWSSELTAARKPFAGFTGDCYEIEATIDPRSAKQITFVIRGATLSYDVEKSELTLGDTRASVPLVDGLLELQILVDRTSIEAFAADGRATITQCFSPALDDLSLSLSGPGAQVKSLKWWRLKSAWDTAEPRCGE